MNSCSVDRYTCAWTDSLTPVGSFAEAPSLYQMLLKDTDSGAPPHPPRLGLRSQIEPVMLIPPVPRKGMSHKVLNRVDRKGGGSES